MKWRVEMRFKCWAIVDENNQDVVYIDDEPRYFDGKPCGSVTSQGRTSLELEHIAYLIAAAPEMQEALELLLKERREDNHPAQSQRLAEEALAKAGGRQ